MLETLTTSSKTRHKAIEAIKGFRMSWDSSSMSAGYSLKHKLWATSVALTELLWEKTIVKIKVNWW